VVQVPSVRNKIRLGQTGGIVSLFVSVSVALANTYRMKKVVLSRQNYSYILEGLEHDDHDRYFWIDYSNEIIARLSRQDLISRYQVAVDFDASSSFSPDDLNDWPGRA
jgi:hypothetical protein